LAQDEPGGKAKGGGEYQEGEVRLEKGKVKGNLLAKRVTDLINVLLGEQVLGAPLLYPLAVEGVVVQGEYRLDELPLPALGSNTGAAIVLGQGQEKVDQTKAFGLADGLLLKELGNVLLRGLDTDSVQPVLNTLSIDFGPEMLLGSYLDKDEDGCVVDSAADLRGEASLGEGLDQLGETSFGFG
jgi:hypothetical protein